MSTPGTLVWPPNYVGEIARRMELEKAIASDPVMLAGARALYAASPATFIADCCWVYEPRNAAAGLPTRLPVVPFPRQREFIEWMHERFRTKTSAPVEKSRDSGATWMASAFAVWVWLFHEGSSVGFGSRKEDLVDRAGDMQSIFEKIRSTIRHLPPYLKPPGLKEKVHFNHMRIVHPTNDSSIIGEAGDNIGRGGRTSAYFIDEAQPLDCRVLTPAGWVRMGDIVAGDDVLGPDGRSRKVIGINDCGEHPIYRLTFTDGTSTECSPNHLWAVERVFGSRKKKMVLRVKEMLGKYRYDSPGGQTQYRYRIPVCQPLEFTPQGSGLPLDPYLCGALIGDGSYASHGTVRITTADQEIVGSFRSLLPSTVRVGKCDGRYGHNLVSAGEGRGRAQGGGYKPNRMRSLLDEAGLTPAKANLKSIPSAYKFAPPAARLALLQGLMDTDGHCGSVGQTSFHTSSPVLADDVKFVARSLGAMCWHTVKQDRRGFLDQHVVQIAMPPGVNPFRLKRKSEAYGKRANRQLSRAIVSIDEVGTKPARCISVDAPDGLYITDDFIVTHNSAFLERPALVEASLSATTDVRIDISTPAAGSVFDAWTSSSQLKFIFDVSDAPWHTPEWLAAKEADMASKGLGHLYRREFLRDASAGLAGQLIPSPWVEAAVGAAEKLGIRPSGKKIGALDVADGGNDRNALAMRHGICLNYCTSRADTLAGDAGLWAFDEATRAGMQELRYDSIGVGAGAATSLRGKKGITIVGWSASDGVVDPLAIYEGNRTNEDMFSNAKAQAWWLLRDRFLRTYQAVVMGKKGLDLDTLISLDGDLEEIREIKSELSQVTYKHNPSGKVQINKAPDGHASPNRADSIVIAFAPVSAGISVIGIF